MIFSCHFLLHFGVKSQLRPFETLDPPFSPKNYIKAIDICKKAKMEVIIIDSLSHAWSYLKSYHATMAGNSFQNWGTLKPLHSELIDMIIQTPIHFICTLRTKHDYVMTEKNGKLVPEKVGLKAVTTDDTEYEFSVVFELDIAHQATVSKDRTGLFAPLKVPFVITEDTGRVIKEWCDRGVTIQDIADWISQTKSIDELNDLYRQYPDLYTLLQPEFKAQKDLLTKQLTKAQSNGIANS